MNYTAVLSGVTGRKVKKMVRTYVVMVRDELGDESRAYGSPALEQEYSFPDFDDNDDAMWFAFDTWRETIETRLQEEYGREGEVFLERKHDNSWFRAECRARGIYPYL